MRYTDIYIKRPVLAIVISLIILFLGIRSVNLLPVREFPFTQNAVVTITTAYTGADPDLISGFITAPLERAVAQANGIDYLTSSSNQNVSTITANLRLNYDPQKALTEISTQVNSVLNQLPTGAQLPATTVAVGGNLAAMYIGFSSDDLKGNQITDYLVRVVQPKFQAVPDVQLAEIVGGKNFAMRAWLDPTKMSALGITSTDVSAALAANNFIAAVGRTDGESVTVNLTTDTSLLSVEDFSNLVIKSIDGALIRLKDVGTVSLGAENYDTSVKFDGKSAVYVAIQIAPAANLLTVIENVKKVLPEVQAGLPKGMKAEIVYDSTRYVNSSIHEVQMSLVEAIGIVIFVIFIFLGSLRTVLVPIIAIPLSIIGTFFIMFLLGYSINLLTLLALVLCIGLVVDDAIIVVENIYRHMERGMKPFDAAILGAHELAKPILAITVVLIAVYIPIGFMGGLTGALFTEFAFTLAAAVTVSAVIALTLSPMMCSKILKTTAEGNFAKNVNHQFGRLEGKYARFLNNSLDQLPVYKVFVAIVLASLYFLYANSRSELAPQEDQGVLLSSLTASPNATLEQTQAYGRQVFDIYSKYPEKAHIFQIEGRGGLNSGFYGFVLKPWDERAVTASALQSQVQPKLAGIAGANVVVFQRPSLPGSGNGLPFQIVLQTTDTPLQLNDVAQDFMQKARSSGMFMFLDSDLKIDKKQISIEIDRQKAALLGLSMRDIGNVLQSSISQGYVNYFNYSGRAYKVIPQVERKERINASQILNYHVKAADGTTVPLSTIATIKSRVTPESLNHFEQLNSATISGVATPGTSLGQAVAYMKNLAAENLPAGYTVDFSGQSRQYVQEGGSLVITFFFSILIIFLCLSALFNSFRDPLIVLISVPMSICGAMIFIALGFGGATLNIYTQVGLVTLIGLISKHGILIVQFANDLREAGLDKRHAIQQAAAIRLRPILVTTAAMALGVIPLLTASGAGAISRFSIGLVIFTGISIGTLFTLFVVPAMYMILSKETSTT